jgi:hypothetical protein
MQARFVPKVGYRGQSGRPDYQAPTSLRSQGRLLKVAAAMLEDIDAKCHQRLANL